MSAAALLVLARCSGFVSRAPGFGHPSVPPQVRVLIAVALALAVAPAVRGMHAPDGFLLLIALCVEALFGAAIGTFAALLYDGAYAGGRIVDDYAGVRAIAPSVALVAPSGFGRIWSLVFTAGFFLFGAYRGIILAFADSFRIVPPGGGIPRDALFAYGVALPETIVLVALSVAGPAIALTFVVQVALAALARTIPRFSTFPLTSTLVFMGALLVTLFTVPVLEHAAAHPVLYSPLLESNR